MDYSDYIIFADESGDHSLTKIDRDFPLFVLAFCIFKKADYLSTVAPLFNEFKFNYWGHESVVLHNHEIRKAINRFSFLREEFTRTRFLDDLTILMDQIPYVIISAVIHKNELKESFADRLNPYTVALRLCLESTYRFLCEQNQNVLLSHLVVEERGRKEDRDLELSFRKILDQSPLWKSGVFEIEFVNKKANLIGLQIADLVVNPIGKYIMNPFQSNRSCEVVKRKIWGWPEKMDGGGLIDFPLKRETPVFTEV